MSYRSKEKASEIVSWYEATRALERILIIESRIANLESKALERTGQIEKRLGEESAGLLSRVEVLRRGLERFFNNHSHGLRSRSLPSGRIGFRIVSRLAIENPASTLKRLSRLGLGDCIRIREEIDHGALDKLDERTLKKIGVKRVTRDVFYASPRKKTT